MQYSLCVAGILALLVGAIHSILGEVLIFRHLRSHGWVPTLAAAPLRERHVRVLWATWHVVTVLGWALGAVLIWLSSADAGQSVKSVFENAVIVSFSISALLVFWGTRARHPGWIGLLTVAVLTWLS